MREVVREDRHEECRVRESESESGTDVASDWYQLDLQVYMKLHHRRALQLYRRISDTVGVV